MQEGGGSSVCRALACFRQTLQLDRRARVPGDENKRHFISSDETVHGFLFNQLLSSSFAQYQEEWAIISDGARQFIVSGLHENKNKKGC